jgi:hypothetical protein
MILQATLYPRQRALHHNVPSSMKVSQVLDTIVRQSCGMRPEVSGRIVLPDETRVSEAERKLRKALSLAEQGIHYSVRLQTPEAKGSSRKFWNKLPVDQATFELNILIWTDSSLIAQLKHGSLAYITDILGNLFPTISILTQG